MWRPWLSLLLLLSIVLYTTVAEDRKLPACKANQACIIFTTDSCRVNDWVVSKTKRGYFWDHDSVCLKGTYDGLNARLYIEPADLRKWKFEVETNYAVEKIGFEFGSANITFPSDISAKFVWTKGGEVRFSSHNVAFVSTFNNDNVLYREYKFEIESDREKLLDLFGEVKEVYFLSEDKRLEGMGPLNDTRFVPRLRKTSQCDLAELNEVCYGTCQKISISTIPGGVANCSSRLWFHSPSDAVFQRHWQAVDDISCHMGVWQAKWDSGNQQIDASHEVQCSEMEPATMTSKMKMVLGFGIGVPLLLILIVICSIVVCRRRRMNKDRSETNTGTTQRKTHSEKAQTPQTPKKSKSDKKASSTDIEGKTTNREGNLTELMPMKWNEDAHGVIATRPPPPPSPFKPQEPKGAAAAAGPPLPTGFASQTM